MEANSLHSTDKSETCHSLLMKEFLQFRFERRGKEYWINLDILRNNIIVEVFSTIYKF